MVRVYADGVPVYAPNLDGYGLQALQVTNSVEKAGTATITMPPGHPAQGVFTAFKTIVTVQRFGKLIFRGRPLPPEDGFWGDRTITCEGERCFLRDAVMRAYSYKDKAVSVIFTDAITAYNSQVEEAKRFKIGRITVTDTTAEAFENEQAEQVSDTVDALVSTYGGYIVFTTDEEDGSRVINWLAELEGTSAQRIEFGENLLDFSRNGANTDMATAILPYGAKNSKDKYLDIKSVNGGLDYIQDDEAVALRGFILKPFYWDDIKKAATLLTRARQQLAASKMIVTTLELSAVDLSALDRDIDSFDAGAWVRVYSAPHNVDDDFLVRERTFDLLDPASDKIVLGADVVTLTSADVAGDKNSLHQLRQTANSIKVDYTEAISEANGGSSDDGEDDTGGDVVITTGTLSVQHGHVEALGNTGSGDYTDAAVTFPAAFLEGTTPTVIVGFSTESTAGTFGRCSCAVVKGSETNTGFTLRFFNGDSSNRNPDFDWIAIGQM